MAKGTAGTTVKAVRVPLSDGSFNWDVIIPAVSEQTCDNVDVSLHMAGQVEAERLAIYLSGLFEKYAIVDVSTANK